MWISGGNRKSYGPNPRLALNPESGEILESGRDLIRIHGGRQEIYNSQTGLWVSVKNPELKKTQGCMRCFDDDINILKSIPDNLMKKDSEEFGGKLTVLNDLVEIIENELIPLSGTKTTYRRPDEKSSEEEKNEWNNLLKHIFR